MLKTSYCNALMTSLKIKKVIITSQNLDGLKSVMQTDSDLSEEMKQFITSIKYWYNFY